MNIDFFLNRFEECKDTAAVIAPEKAYTYAELQGQYQISRKWIEDCGVPSGSVVALYADYSADAIALLLALMSNDCILVPLSKTILDPEPYLRISQSEFLIDVTGAKRSIRTTGAAVFHEMLLTLRAKKAPGLILFSSGTTGEPKAALHDLGKLLQKFKKPGKTWKTIAFLLFDHIGGFNTLMHTISHGGTLVTISTRTPAEVCEIIEKHRIELLPTTPTFLNMIVLNKLYRKYDLTSLKLITYGTESMPEHTLRLFSNILPLTVFKQTYGLSELGIMPTKSESSDSIWMKVGGDGFETKIEDGILFIRADSAMLGYLNAPSPFDAEGWFDTRDKVEEKDGYLKILGRTTDLINVGGEKVYPVEVENVLLQIEGVLDARVFAERNPLTGYTVACEVLVAPENNHSAFRKTLRHSCGEYLEPYKRPVRYLLTETELHTDRLKKKH